MLTQRLSVNPNILHRSIFLQQMGSEGEIIKARKSHYNISMSRRTRKPQNIKEGSEKKDEQFIENREQKSLKELIEGRCSLAQHFKEDQEKEQSVVVRPPDQDGIEGVRLKRSMMRNYAKILSHLIKVKQESCIRSWKKTTPSFKLIEHK